MPRARTVPDEHLLDAALLVVREFGPDGLTFGVLAPRVGLAASTIVQRFGTKALLLRAALGRAWDLLDADTARADAEAGPGAAGVVDLLVALSGQYDVHGDYADGLLVLREDLRDPVLRERGRAWIDVVIAAIERRLPSTPATAGVGGLVVAQWQGVLTVWGFTRDEPLRTTVRRAATDLLDRLAAAGAPGVPAAPAAAPTPVALPSVTSVASPTAAITTAAPPTGKGGKGKGGKGKAKKSKRR